jgi:mono/diheme cytochrome c family protein
MSSNKSRFDSLANDNLNGSFDGFSDAAFRRARLLPALFSGLGVAVGDACCLDTSNLPPPQTSPIGEQGTGAPAHARFNQYCGQCHLGAERAPPNFLAGDTAVVEAALRHCAPRIFVRLSMWQSSPDVRAKTPMPPDVALHRMEVSADAWRDGEPLATLWQSTWERLRAETGRPPQLDGLLRDGYENLRACLPD